jgi:hypothetical protein
MVRTSTTSSIPCAFNNAKKSSISLVECPIVKIVFIPLSYPISPKILAPKDLKNTILRE